jgi:hypothetical protein
LDNPVKQIGLSREFLVQLEILPAQLEIESQSWSLEIYASIELDIYANTCSTVTTVMYYLKHEQECFARYSRT